MAVGISHEGYMEAGDLQGRTVAEIRELYQIKFSIPEKAVAVLNGRDLEHKKEDETLVNDCDELAFVVRGRSKLPLLVGALLLALVATGGIFAYTWTTASVTLSGTAESDFAAIEPDGTPPNFGTVMGKWWGSWTHSSPDGVLFTVTPNTNYNGDLLVKLYLTNAPQLSRAFQHLNLHVELLDSTYANLHTSYTGHTFQLLTADNGVVTLDLQQNGNPPYYVYLVQSTWKTNPRSPLDWTSGFSVAPSLYCEVTQR